MHIYSFNIEIAWYINTCATHLFYPSSNCVMNEKEKQEEDGPSGKRTIGTMETTNGFHGGGGSGSSLKGAVQPDISNGQHG